MSDLTEELKRKASPKAQKAMRQLERRGLRFLVHFGTENAEARLKALDRAYRYGYLYDHMSVEFGL